MEAITSSQRRAWPRPAGPVEPGDVQAGSEDEPDWLRYWMLMSRWWRSILIVTAVATFATWSLSEFYLQRWYRANAILTPMAQPLTPGVSGVMGAGAVGSIAELFGGGSLGETTAQEYISILKSFAFTISLAERHPPVAAFALEINNGVSPRTQWELYKIINGGFDCDYNIKTGNLSLSFVAKTREDARRILGYYVDDLRDKLRGREVHEAGIAVASLREEINKTSDSLLQSQLYELMATQLQREKLAQVEADFAFTVIEPPMVSDSPYRPRPIRYGALVLIFAPLLMFGAIHAFDRIARMSAEVRRRTAARGPSGNEAEASEGRSYAAENRLDPGASR